MQASLRQLEHERIVCTPHRQSETRQSPYPRLPAPSQLALRGWCRSRPAVQARAPLEERFSANKSWRRDLIEAFSVTVVRSLKKSYSDAAGRSMKFTPAPRSARTATPALRSGE